MGTKEFTNLYNADLYRYGGADTTRFVRKFHYFLRKAQTTKGLVKKYYHTRLAYHREKHGIEISDEIQIGKGLYIGHPWNITINTKAVIGENCNIHKGVTIGRENRGKRKGAPVIGNAVWIGINATIVGNVKIGNDVLITPNSYVNCDVPDHSIVLGNPCKVIPKEHATENYLNNLA